jgi:hypothetical protein
MKIREIIVNKWAWAGAIIFVVLTVLRSSLREMIIQRCSMADAIYSAQCTAFVSNFIILIAAIIGFIIGLIAQKIWRKFK